MPLNHNQQGRQPNSPLITESRDCSAVAIYAATIFYHPFLSSHHQHHHGLQLTLSVTALRYLSLGQDASREEVRTTSATAVYEVARPILQGCHAIPTKLKILLDRALSALAQEEVLMIVSGCGWQLDDYQRGYKLKVTYPPLLSLPPLACFCNPRTLAMTHNGQGLHAEMDPNDQLGQFSYFITHSPLFLRQPLGQFLCIPISLLFALIKRRGAQPYGQRLSLREQLVAQSCNNLPIAPSSIHPWICSPVSQEAGLPSDSTFCCKTANFNSAPARAP